MSNSKHLDSINTAANIGVALGPASRGLCCVDVDKQKHVETILNLNPFLNGTFQVRTSRGCHFYVQMQGEYATKKFQMYFEGDVIGEFLTDGQFAVIHGTHPSGVAYQIVNEAPPIEITFDQLQFPAGTRTERTERTKEDRRGTPSFGWREISLREMLLGTKPLRPHNNHHLLFLLARGVRALETQEGRQYSRAELRDVFNQWYAAAQPYVRKTLTAEDYFMEFLELNDYATTSLGSGVVETAWKQAQESPPPPEAEQFESTEYKALTSLCWHLQQHMGAEPFYLSCRTVQRLFGLETHTQAARRLSGLVRFGVLEVAEMGGPKTNRATRYRYVAISH